MELSHEDTMKSLHYIGHRIDVLQEVNRELVEALKEAKQFIENGVEFGCIYIPDADPALKTLPKIKQALFKAGAL